MSFYNPNISTEEFNKMSAHEKAEFTVAMIKKRKIKEGKRKYNNEASIQIDSIRRVKKRCSNM